MLNRVIAWQRQRQRQKNKVKDGRLFAMLDRVIAWQRQRQKDKDEKKQRQRRSPLYNVGPSDNLDRSWVEVGTPSPSASRTASRISPEILSFMRGAWIFGKNIGFCTNQGWGRVFRNRNFW